MLRVKSRIGAWLLMLGGLAIASPARGGVAEDFPLSKAIPADACFAVHTRDHAGQEFLNKQFARLWEALENEHLEKDVKRLFKSMAEENGSTAEEFDAHWQQINDLLTAVEWGSLAEKEYAMGMRIGVPPEFVALMRSPADKVKGNFDGLSGILKTLVSLAPEGVMTLTSEGDGESVVHKLAFSGAPFPLGFMLSRQKDVIAIGFGSGMPEQSLALLTGKTGEALVASERFQNAFKKLPPAKDSAVFVDVDRMFKQIRATFEQAMQMSGEEIDPKIKAFPGKVLDTLAMWDYVAVVKSTEGMKTTEESACIMKENAKSLPFYKSLYGNGTLKDPLKFVPQTAQDVTANSGVDLMATYAALLTFIKEEVPDGERAMTEWEDAKQQIPFDIEKDLLAWIGGGFTTFTLPGKSAYSPPDWVVMLTVNDAAKANEMIDRALEAAAPFMQQGNATVEKAEIAGAENFRTLNVPMLMMMPGIGAPTFGVHEKFLFISSGPKPIAAALAAAKGEAPNFSKNERFMKEGLAPDANATAMSFTDLTKLGEQLSQLLQMTQLIQLFGGPEIAKDPAAKTVFSVARKLGNVVKKLDFFQSSSSVSTFDGKVSYTKSVTNYREPPAPKAETPNSESAKEEKPEGTGASNK
ncbi:hypothetical protein RAS1_12860 [Phycisphaerae bacterium RAS1]|nr:hypothetical protein RAS1_12860 [Phycisphaerae bacterium RAS1]